MGLIILQLHGHAPYGNITVSLLCVVLRGRQDPGTACRFPLWAFYGQLEWCTDEKWRSLQAPLFLSDFAPGNHIYLKKVLWPRLIFVPVSMLIWENVSVFFHDTKRPVHSRYCFIQIVLHKKLSFDQIYYLKDDLSWNIWILPTPSYNSQSHIVLTLVTFYMSVPVTHICACRGFLSLLWDAMRA